MMKIVHFLKGRCNPDTANGVEKTIYHLAVNQAAMGHEVHVVGVSPKPAIPIPGVAVRYFRPEALPGRLPEGLTEHLLGIAPNMVHFHSAYILENILLARVLKANSIPYAVTPNGNCSRHLLKRRPYLKIPFKLLLERPYMNGAALVHSVGDGVEIRHYGVRVPMVEAPNGFDPSSLLEWNGDNLILLARPNWKGRTTFVFIGRLDVEQKGLDLLLSAVHQAAKKASIGVALVGPDWNGGRARLEARVKELGIDDSVFFNGPAYGMDKYGFLASGDYFIHTSRWEGMAFSVVEALACGKPCLVTAAANPCGLIGQYPAGCLVEGTPEAIAKAMVELANLPEEKRKAMSAAGTQLVRTELGWRRIAETVTEGYQTHLPR